MIQRITGPTSLTLNEKKAVLPYKYDFNSFKRDVPALEMNRARNYLETKSREAINDLYKQLHNRINPDTRFVDSIRNSILAMAAQVDPMFKIERFDGLLSSLVRLVEGQFNKIVTSFDDWFREFIVGVYDKPLLKSVYYSSPGTVRCTLYWSNPDDLHNYPHLMLDNFYQCISENMSTYTLSFAVLRNGVTSLKESCKKTRLNYFKEVKKVNEVKEAVEAFAHKVQQEMSAIRRK